MRTSRSVPRTFIGRDRATRPALEHVEVLGGVSEVEQHLAVGQGARDPSASHAVDRVVGEPGEQVRPQDLHGAAPSVHERRGRPAVQRLPGGHACGTTRRPPARAGCGARSAAGAARGAPSSGSGVAMAGTGASAPSAARPQRRNAAAQRAASRPRDQGSRFCPCVAAPNRAALTAVPRRLIATSIKNISMGSLLCAFEGVCICMQGCQRAREDVTRSVTGRRHRSAREARLGSARMSERTCHIVRD